MTVSEIMSTEVKAVPPTMTVSEARALMRQEQIHHLVVTRGANLLGVVSARDLNRRVNASTSPRTVADVMTRHVLTTTGQATLGRAAYLMRGHTIGCLVVLGRGRVVGIVTPADLLTLLGRSGRSKRSDSRTARHARVKHGHRSRGDGMW